MVSCDSSAIDTLDAARAEGSSGSTCNRNTIWKSRAGKSARGLKERFIRLPGRICPSRRLPEARRSDGPLRLFRVTAESLEIARPFLERLALLVDVVVNVVGGFHARPRMVEHALRDVDFDGQTRQTGAPRAA